MDDYNFIQAVDKIESDKIESDKEYSLYVRVMDTLMQVYHHNQWDNILISELLDYYTIGLNKLYKESILSISTMGYPKDPDFGDEIKPVDIYSNVG